MRTYPIAIVIAVAASTLVATPTLATVVNGRVTSTGGAGIVDVDIDFIDRNTGQSVPLTNDNTDILGFYSVIVPTGDYDVQFEPAPGDRFVAHEEQGVRVQGASMTLDQVLQSGWFVTGRVVNDSAVPIANVDLDIIDVVDGEVFLANDVTAANGSFSVVVPTAVHDVEFKPPIGTNLVPRQIPDLNVTGDTGLGDVALLDGFHLSGTVVNPFALPVTAVQVQTLDPFTGEEIFNVRRNTDLLGIYDVVVAPGGYDLLFVPPRGEPVLPRFLSGVEVQGAVNLPTVTLDAGVVASGKVIDSASNAVTGVDLDFVDVMSGVERLTPRDNVDNNGEYDIAVPVGTYDSRYDPFAGSVFASGQLLGVNLSSNTSLPTVVLANGQAISGNVQDGFGNPLAGVDFDFFDVTSGVEIPITNDNTDLSGAFSVLVPAGTYDIVLTPVPGSGVGQEMLLSVVVAGPLGLGTIVLPAASQAAPGSIAPTSGGATGGTFVTVSGSNFAPGVSVWVGGIRLSGLTRVDSTTVQGTTGSHRVGVVDVRVTNPGVIDAALPSAFTYTAPVVDPVLTLDKTGPLGTDVLLGWTAAGQPSYTVFRSATASGFANQVQPLDKVPGLSFRDDGAASLTAADNILFYVVQ